jgi:hypothetical protein
VVDARMPTPIAQRGVLAPRADLQRAASTIKLVPAVAAETEHAWVLDQQRRTLERSCDD